MSDFELDFDVFAGDGEFQWEESTPCDTRELGDLGDDAEDESLGSDSDSLDPR